MNDKSHAATPANATSSESNAKPDDGIAGNVTNRNSLHADSHPETVGERLKRFYPEHYVTIITEMNRVDGPERTARILNNLSYEGTLWRCFIWERSQQGYGFWANLAKREQS